MHLLATSIKDYYNSSKAIMLYIDLSLFLLNFGIVEELQSLRATLLLGRRALPELERHALKGARHTTTRRTASRSKTESYKDLRKDYMSKICLSIYVIIML